MKTITVTTHTRTTADRVWEYWNTPEHIVHWCHASDDWYTPAAENDLRVGGRFRTAYAARDGSASFDFEGTYTEVVPHERIVYTIDDGRTVEIVFSEEDEGTWIIETFEMEDENSEELQRGGWQSILDNFRRYVNEKH